MLRAAALRFGLLLPAAVMAQTPVFTRFHRDPALMRVRQAQFVAAVKAKDPTTASALETAFPGWLYGQKTSGSTSKPSI